MKRRRKEKIMKALFIAMVGINGFYLIYIIHKAFEGTLCSINVMNFLIVTMWTIITYARFSEENHKKVRTNMDGCRRT